MKTRAKLIVLVSMVAIVLAAWHVATAEGDKSKKAKTRKVVLPTAAAAAVKKAFPKATIDEVERERESIALYEVELQRDGKEFEVVVTPDGQIVAVEKQVARGDLPEAVAKKLADLAGDAKIKQIEKEEIHAVVKVVKLKKPKVVYEAEFVKDGKEIEVKITVDGKLLGTKAEKTAKHERHDKDDDDDEDDDD